MSKAIKKIKELQRAPDSVKKRWLIGGTTVSMILVVSLWVFYLNTYLPKINPEQNETQETENGDSVGSILKRGFENISTDLKEKIGNSKKQADSVLENLKMQIQKTNEFSVESENENLNLPSEEESSSTLLP